MKEKQSLPKILSTDSDSWLGMAGNEIRNAVKNAIAEKGNCSIMLTGGNTAECLYSFLEQTGGLPVGDICFLFGDERCVAPTEAESNYGMAMRTLFPNGMPSSYTVYRMEAEARDKAAAVKRYESILPEIIDIILLGLGLDGHIASIFPCSDLMNATGKKVAYVIGPKPPYERFSVTAEVITNAKEIFLLALGTEKGKILAKAITSPEDAVKLPVCLATKGTWLLDTEAHTQLPAVLFLNES